MEIVISLGAAVVSLVSAYIAYRSMGEQKRITKLAASYPYLASAEMLMEKYGDLLELHGVHQSLLDDCKISRIELLYLIESFSAADLYHRIDTGRKVSLSAYRENLLSNVKVQEAWSKIIKGRFLSESSFSKEVDKFIETKRTLQKASEKRALEQK